MKCGKCNENEAAYYISHESAGGAKIGFCDTCAEEIGIFSALRRVESLLHGYGLKAEENPLLGKYSLPMEFAESCKSCGTDLREFERRFFFGCEECGVVFGSLIANYLTLLGSGAAGGVSAYPGKPPSSYTAKNDLQVLNSRIRKAVEAEDYKKAGELRERYDEREEKILRLRKQRMAVAGKKDEIVPEADPAAREQLICESSTDGAAAGTWLMTTVETRRNFSDFKFPPRLDALEMNFVSRYITGLFTDKWLKDKQRVQVGALCWRERKALETRLLGRRLYPGAAMLADPGCSSVALINNMDHLTLISNSVERDAARALKPLRDALNPVERKADIAYSSRFGYLTTAPRHLGAGLCASVILHLPYSLFRGRTYEYPSRAMDKPIKFEPLLGGNFEQHGFFRVSTTVGFGREEEEIVGEVMEFASALALEEEKIRASFSLQETRRLENVMVKILQHAAQSYRLAYPDVLRLTSFISLAVERGIVEMPGFRRADVLPSQSSSFIMYRDRKRYSVNECEKRRADLFSELVREWERR